jgi:hypothetical protein
MTMYLPNPVVRPAESDPVEFIEPRPGAVERQSAASASGEQRAAGTVHLSPQARSDITRWARDYITARVANHRGDSEDVQAIISDLGDQITGPGRRPAG